MYLILIEAQRTGCKVVFAGELGGVVQVLHDPQHPSYLELPGVGICAAPCKPLPVPNLIRG